MSKRKIAVLMTTYNGIDWIAEQLKSILDQSDVDLCIFISDDCSTDGTFEYLLDLSKLTSRIILLPRYSRIGSAGKNFYRILLDMDLRSFDYVAFADQDDVWNSNKLASHVALIKEWGAEAVSSDVIAFWPDGCEKLIVKSHPQQLYDFLFESAGPGCTFLMTPWLAEEVKRLLLLNDVAMKVELHDWLTYAVCRAHNKTWVIDAKPSMRYRQHKANVVGANSGLKPALARLEKIYNGWYRHQVALVSSVVASINHDNNFLLFQKIIQRKTVANQLRLLSYVPSGRREPVARLCLFFSVLLFIF